MKSVFWWWNLPERGMVNNYLLWKKFSWGWKCCCKKFHSHDHDCREHSSRRGNSSTLPILNYGKKQRNNVTANSYSILFSIYPRNIWRKWREELTNYIWYECQRWNGWWRVWEICHKPIDSSVLRFWRCSWKKSCNQGWQWPWSSKCGVACISMDARLLSLSRYSKYHSGYTKNGPKLW